MPQPELYDWARYRHIATMFPDAAERGRLMTAVAMRDDHEGRKRVEDAVGIELCMKLYPEAYKGGFARWLEKVVTWRG